MAIASICVFKYGANIRKILGNADTKDTISPNIEHLGEILHKIVTYECAFCGNPLTLIGYSQGGQKPMAEQRFYD